MTRYLHESFLRNALARGRGVEQFLGGFVRDGQHAVRWLSVSADDGEDDDLDDDDDLDADEDPGDDDARGEGWVLRMFESMDPQVEGWWDVHSFGELDGVDQGDAAATHRCESVDDALAIARDRYAARDEAWVNEGMVGDEYRDYFYRSRPQADTER